MTDKTGAKEHKVIKGRFSGHIATLDARGAGGTDGFSWYTIQGVSRSIMLSGADVALNTGKDRWVHFHSKSM